MAPKPEQELIPGQSRRGRWQIITVQNISDDRRLIPPLPNRMRFSPRQKMRENTTTTPAPSASQAHVEGGNRNVVAVIGER